MRTVLKWTLRLGLGIVGLVLALIGTTYAVSEIKLRSSYDLPESRVAIPSDAASIERGRHLATAIGKCIDCHAEDFGGKMVIDDFAVGVLAGPNLTRAGRGAEMHDTDWVRAIRHGVRHDGTPLALMPSEEYYHFDDDELGAVIAYIKSLPPVQRSMPSVSVGPVIRAMNVLGIVPMSAEVVDHFAARKPAPPAGPTPAYGEHIVNLGCRGCHGEGMGGGPIPGAPPEFLPAANLTMHATGLGSWTEQDFFMALRSGRRPNGGLIDQKSMPWNMTKLMTDDEIRAVWAYLGTLPAKEVGSR